MNRASTASRVLQVGIVVTTLATITHAIAGFHAVAQYHAPKAVISLRQSEDDFNQTLLNADAREFEPLASLATIAPRFIATETQDGRSEYQEFSPEEFQGTEKGEVRSYSSVSDLKLCWIPPGTFQLGSPATEQGREDHEFQEEVTFQRGFWMAQTETTQSQWTAVIDSLPKAMIGQEPTGPLFPVFNVTWHEATEYCERLTNRERAAGRIGEGMSFVLPTEKQWEYAYRSGSTTAFYWGNSGDDLGAHAWFMGNTEDVGEPYAHRVAQKIPNKWNLYDMAGNVLEWCSDPLCDRRHLFPVEDLPETLLCKNTKGMSFAYRPPRFFRAAMRNGFPPDGYTNDLGFRIILSQEE